jgi:hypothetical protein
MTIFDGSLNHVKELWARLASMADSVGFEKEQMMTLSPWRPTVNNRDRPSWEQEGYSREPESSLSRRDSHGGEVLFVRSKTLSGSNILLL